MGDGGADPDRGGSPRLAAIVAGTRDDATEPGTLITEADRGRRTAPALGRGSWAWQITFVLALVAAIVAIPFLALMGKEAVEDSTRGRMIGVVTDPSAPGFEVLVEPSPTMLLLQTEGDDLDAVTFLAKSSETTGSALFLPPLTAVEGPDGPITLRDAWDDGGEAGLTDAVESLLGIGIAEFSADGSLLATSPDDVPVVRVDRAQWAQLVDPVAPLTVDSPDAVEAVGADGEIEVRFPAGEFELEAEAVGPFLAARGDGEVDLNRMLRHQRFWEAWIAAVAAAGGRDAVAGEQETGLGAFVTTFAEGEAGFVPVEASTVRIPGVEDEVYAVTADWLTALVAEMVPFPTSPQPGARPTLRVLDGTGTPDAAITVARELARAGAEIRAIGNGPSFDQQTTQIIYYDPTQESAAQEMRDALGAGTLELQEDLDDVVAVTVVLGTDVVDGLDLPARPDQ
jgi:hypothetical protein